MSLLDRARFRAECGHDQETILIHLHEDQFYPEALDPDGIGFLADVYGEPLGIWADGTVGTGKARDRAVRDSEDAYCLTCLSPLEWSREP